MKVLKASRVMGIVAIASLFVATLATETHATAGARVSSSETMAAQARPFTLDGKTVRAEARKSFQRPAEFNWESVRVETIEVSSGGLTGEASKEERSVRVRITGDRLLDLRVLGTGDSESPLDVTFSLRGADVVLSPGGVADVDLDLRVRSDARTRIWTRARHVGKGWLRVAFRMTAINRPFDVTLRAKARFELSKDGVLTARLQSWSDPRNQRLTFKLSGKKLPDGELTIQPLDAASAKIDMDIMGGIGDRTVQNPLVAALRKVQNRPIRLGKIPLP